MKIKVEKFHIQFAIAERNSKKQFKKAMCSWCPVALAMKQYGIPARVYGNYIQIDDRTGWFDMPDRLLAFIKSFDREKYLECEPFVFDTDELIHHEKLEDIAN